MSPYKPSHHVVLSSHAYINQVTVPQPSRKFDLPVSNTRVIQDTAALLNEVTVCDDNQQRTNKPLLDI